MDLELYTWRGILPPALFAGMLLLGGWLSKKTVPESRRWLGAVAIGGGFLLGFALFLGLPSFPPSDAEAGVFWLAAAGVLVGVLERESMLARWLLRSVVAFLAPWLLLRRMVSQWEQTRVVMELLTLGGAILVVWILSDAWARRRAGASVPLVLWLCAAGTAAAQVMGASAKYGQISGMLAAALGAAAVVAWLRPALVLTGGAGVFAVVVGSLCIAGSYVAEVPREAAALLLAAPLAAWLGEFGPVARMSPAKAVLARMLLVAVPLGTALWRVYLARPEPYAG